MEMKTEYRRDLQHTWMILSGGDMPQENSYSVRMLTENRIDGLLPCRVVRLDGEPRLYYDISSRHPIAARLESEQIGRRLLEQILTALAKVMENLSEYLLDPDGLLLDPRYLYCDSDLSGIRFCWYPGKEIRFAEQARILGGALLPQLEQADRAGVVIGYRFYQYCEAEELTLDALRGLLRQRIAEQEVRPATREEIERSAILDSFFDDTEEEEPAIGSLGRKLRALFSKRRNRGSDPEKDTQEEEYNLSPDSDAPDIRLLRETGPSYTDHAEQNPPRPAYTGTAFADRAEASETRLLSPDMLTGKPEHNWILRVTEEPGKERVIPLTADHYLVGKTGFGATLQLSSSAVSRLHAKLQKKDDAWTVQDMNSRNGTWRKREENKGEILLQPEEPVILQEGDEIRFADVTCRIVRQ